jgi:hypothetical protein
LARRVNTYHAQVEKKLGVPRNTYKILPDALFFVPNKAGGFNTQSLTIDKTDIYGGTKTSIDYFKTVLQPAYDAYAKNYTGGDKVDNIDDWLRIYQENYLVSKQKQ